MTDKHFFQKLETTTAVGTKYSLETVMAAIPFDRQGLIPVIAQQHDSGEVLMLAWMNQAALTETLQTGRVCYWSRSRQTLWRKGETSGHVQQLISAALDCDGDTLLLQVEQQGPACHTNRRNCFYLQLDAEGITVREVSTI